MSPRVPGGFSLVEVLVALLITSVVSAAMLRSARSAVALRVGAVGVRDAAFAASRALETTFAIRAETLAAGTTEWTTAEGVSVTRQVRALPVSRVVTIAVEAWATGARQVRLETMRAVEWRRWR